MTDGDHGDRERTFGLAKRANDLMRDYGMSATPRSYAIWYTYVAGTHPHLNDAIKRLTGQNGKLSCADIDDLFEAHIDGRRISDQAEKMNANLLVEVEGIIEMIDLSLGATAQYGQSLQAFSNDLTVPSLTSNRLRELIAAIAANTRDLAANNRTLEARMRESLTEIDALRETLETTRKESLTDALTGLANRKHFEDMLDRHVDTKRAEDRPASLIVIDIDKFKRFNDLYGHLTGDQVLRLVAIVMRESVSSPATLARFGGEEFGVLLPQTDRAAAVVIAERIRTSVLGRELIKRSTGESLGKVTISLGIAEQRAGDSAVSLLERADNCLFAAKRAGRNRCIDDLHHDTMPEVA